MRTTFGAMLSAGLATSLLAVTYSTAVDAKIRFSYGGFLRLEGAYHIGDENPYNQGGNYFNDVTVRRTPYLPPTYTPLVSGVVTPSWTSLSLGPVYGDDLRRGDMVPSTENDFSYTILRGEVEGQLRFNRKWRIVTRLRGIYDPTIYDEFDAASVEVLNNYDQEGIQSGPWADPALYQTEPNYFEYSVTDGKGGFENGNPLEIAGRDYMIDLPAAILEYNNRDFNFRIGNQQIAWGQSIFFRVFDVPNGLDLRRHSILDRAMEEFSDKRVPMLSARVTYQLTNNILLDSYVGKFQPTVFGNPNTPYNIIPTQFTVQDRYKAGGYDDEIVGGFRIKGDYGQWGFQLGYANRYGTEGVFRWTETGVEQPLYNGIGPNVLGSADLVNQLPILGDLLENNLSLGAATMLSYNIKSPVGTGLCPVDEYDPETYDASRCRMYESTAEALAHAPFHPGTGGVYSAEEWFRYAAEARLDGILGLNAAVNEFPGAQDVYASPSETFEESVAQLSTFFVASGGSLRGHIAREYFREDNFMAGVSYVIESDIDFFNQLILNLEAQYTPERTYTNPSLSSNYIRQDEIMVSLVADKWHRFFDSFPGTYIVMQALHRNRADLVGRHLSGMGSKTFDELEPGDTRTTRPITHGSTYVVLGFLQPWPNKLYELEFASLIDTEGGAFVQTGLRWNPGHGVTVEGFYNHISDDLWGNRYDNLMSTIDFAEEFTLRVSYQF